MICMNVTVKDELYVKSEEGVTMKVSCEFDKETRTVILIAEDNLENLVLREIAERTAKGSKLQVSAIEQSVATNAVESKGLRVELKVNGH